MIKKLITENEIFLQDIKRIIETDFISWNKLKSAKILVTGATGLIGTLFVNSLLEANRKFKLELVIFALVRNEEKANKNFSRSSALKLLIGTVESFDYNSSIFDIDYIIHAASMTSSKGFIENPVETSETNFLGTMRLLRFAKNMESLKSFIYLSTMEVYGYPEKGHKVLETEIGSFNENNPRSSYPLSKIMCENLCLNYFHEYNVPCKISRLTQTFGPGVEYNDGRVFAEFARCAIEKRAIILKTKGETERSYLYTTDAVTGIIVTMLNGKDGEIYNMANEETYCSIFDMANLVAQHNGIEVKYELQDISKFGYANTLYMDLNTSKMQSLGWKAEVGLSDMFNSLIESMKNIK